MWKRKLKKERRENRKGIIGETLGKGKGEGSNLNSFAISTPNKGPKKSGNFSTHAHKSGFQKTDP